MIIFPTDSVSIVTLITADSPLQVFPLRQFLNFMLYSDCLTARLKRPFPTQLLLFFFLPYCFVVL